MNKIVFKAVTEAAQRREELSKEELSLQRVELATVDQLKSRADKLKAKLKKQSQDVRDMLYKESDRYKTELDKLDSDIKETIKKAQEIGVDIKGLDNLIFDVYDAKGNFTGAASKIR